MTSLNSIKEDLTELLTESWKPKTLDFKHKVMSTVSDTIGTEEYFKKLQSHPIELTETLIDLGPTLRLQLLFSMSNNHSLRISDGYYNWADEVFKNLSLINDLNMLDDLDLGKDGRQLYSKVAHVAQEKKASW